MTQDRIIELAREAGAHIYTNAMVPDSLPEISFVPLSLERFAALVRAQALGEAAKVCDARATKNELACNDADEDEASSLRSAAWQISVCARAIRALKGQA